MRSGTLQVHEARSRICETESSESVTVVRDARGAKFNGDSRYEIERWSFGDARSIWDYVTERYNARLLVYAEHRLGPRLRTVIDKFDLVQEAWQRVWNKRTWFERGHFIYSSPGCFYRYLCTEVSRIAAEWGRRAAKVSDAIASIEAATSRKTIVDVHDPRATPSGVVEGADSVRRLVECLESPRMPEIYRRVLRAIVIQDIDQDEYARKNGYRAEDTLRKQLRRGLQKWRELLGDDPMRYL